MAVEMESVSHEPPTSANILHTHAHTFQNMKNTTIVLYPSAGIGHLISMVELGKLILTHNPSFSITIFISEAPYNTGSTAPYIAGVSSSSPSITFHHLPTVSLPPELTSPTSSATVEDIAFEIPRLSRPHIHRALRTMSRQSNLKAFIIDFFCYSVREVSSALNIPTYFFCTSGASGLCTFLYLPVLDESVTVDFEIYDNYMEIPGMPRVHSSDMLKAVLRRNTIMYRGFIQNGIQMAKASGLLINTVEEIEPRAVKALSENLCTPNEKTPPVYCVGPLLAKGVIQKHECLDWLSSQPSKSVVFLCFGSRGTFKTEQLKEIARGLAASGQRFLWVVKTPPAGDLEMRFSTPEEPDLDELLPGGFLERTQNRGMVVKSWAPQVAVLNHEAIGGFVTHCGWNSVLEAVKAGVPMVAWPLYAEQRMNKVVLVEEMKVAVGVEEVEGGLVTAEEVEKKVRQVMDTVEGKGVRDEVMVMRDRAMAALQEGGSSSVALRKLLREWTS